MRPAVGKSRKTAAVYSALPFLPEMISAIKSHAASAKSTTAVKRQRKTVVSKGLNKISPASTSDSAALTAIQSQPGRFSRSMSTDFPHFS